MTDLTPNLPEVVAEVRARFERHEQALIDKDVAVLDATFWDSPHTVWVHFPDLDWKVVAAHVSTMNDAALG